MKEPLHILYISDFSASFSGSFVDSLCQLAETVRNSGGKVWFIFPSYKPYMFRLKELGDLYILPSFQNKRFDFRLTKLVYKMVKDNNISVIHTQFGLSGYFAGCIVTSFKRRLHVFHERSVSKYLYKHPPLFHYIITKIVFKLFDLLSNTIYIAISNEVKRSLIQYNNIPAHKIVIIPNAVIGKNLDKDTDKSINMVNDFGTRPVVGMVANFGPAKDYEGVIQAARIVVDNDPSVLFVFVGGNLVNDRFNSRLILEDLVDRMYLRNNILFAGEVKNPFPIIERFTVGILYSNTEGFGNVIVEYMLQKKPVIGSSVGGIVDIIEDGKTGFLVPPKNPPLLANKILWLLNNPDRAQDMGVSGYHRAREVYGIDIWLNRIIELYLNNIVY